MADCYCKNMQEPNDVHRLLPPEILKDIGIVDPAEQRRLAVVEDLAMRLNSVLGGAAKITPCHHSQVNIARGLGGRDVLTGGENVRRAAAPFFPAPAVPVRNNMVFHPAAALPGLVPARPLPGGRGAQPTTMRRSGGTGVFFLRNDMDADAKPTRRRGRAEY